jgi:hypothetical protein
MVTSPARILVVSHAPAIRNLISRFLTRQNYRIIDGAPRGKRSANGLLIDGQKLQAHDLQHEDVIVFSPNVEAVYYRLKQDVGNPPDEFDIDDDDLAGGIAPVPCPWKSTPPPLMDGDAISPDRI